MFPIGKEESFMWPATAYTLITQTETKVPQWARKIGTRVSWSGRPPTPSMCRFDKPFATFEEHSRSLEISGRRQKFYKVQTVASIKRRCWFFPLVIIQDQTSVIWPLLVRWLTKTLVHTFLTSKVDYCNSLPYGRPKYLLQRLEILSLEVGH